MPEAISLSFILKSGKWYLELNDGYIDNNDEDKTSGIPPEIHVAIKNIFPNHIDFFALESLLQEEKKINFTDSINDLYNN
jgi:hypothetical protein